MSAGGMIGVPRREACSTITWTVLIFILAAWSPWQVQGHGGYNIIPGQSLRERRYLLKRPNILENSMFQTDQAAALTHLGFLQGEGNAVLNPGSGTSN